jgi:DNA-directed RNA polymerase beta' subunit
MDLKEIEKITFGIFSPEEVRKFAVCKVFSSKLAGPNTVYDDRMGVMENGKLCVSCEEDVKSCSGHFGYIDLNYSVLHPMYKKHILAFLKCFCFKCYNFILTKEHLELNGLIKYQREVRFIKILEKIEKIESCYHCSSPKPKIINSKIDDIIYMIYGKNKFELTESDVKKIFDNVKDSDVELLGLDPKLIHPRNLVISVLPVLPPRSRPFVITDNIVCDDDITITLVEIIKANNHLEDYNLDENKKQKYIQTLKFRIKTLMDNSKGKARHSNGRPIKAIKSRLTGKEGQIRSNLMGKRVDQSGRTVVGPDPTVKTDEMVIPIEVAKNLTIPEKVNNYNIEKLTALVNDGKANYILRDESRINLSYALYKRGTELELGDKILRGDRIIELHKFNSPLQKGDKILRNSVIIEVELPVKKRISLKIGDVVERQLQNGDVVLLNRQPTLWKASMLAKRIIIRPGKTFRMNLSTTKPFNGDKLLPTESVKSVLLSSEAELLCKTP